MISRIHRFLIGVLQGNPAHTAITRAGLAQPLVRRFIAGETIESALELALGLERRGIESALDHVGENVSSEDEAAARTDTYVDILDAAKQRGLRSRYVSVKLTALGLDVDRGIAEANLDRILTAAGTARVVVDMEGSRYTETTLEIVVRAHRRHANAGTVLQAALYRTDGDVETVIREGIPVRLVKGAYAEQATIAHPRRADVDRAYRRHLARLVRSDLPIAVATHDDAMIRAAKRGIRETGRRNETVAFELLLGVREDLRDALAAEGYRTRIYLPFGSEWYPYMVRRLAEHPANVAFLLRNLKPRMGIAGSRGR
jgi:proline dehydrogenase